MKKNGFKGIAIAAMLTFALTLGGCAFTKDVARNTFGSIFTPPAGTQTGPSAADQRQFETIGQEFGTYSATDAYLNDSQKAQDAAVLNDWATNGSTLETYAYVAPRYTAYVNQDGSLALSSKAIRMDNLTAWRIRLESQSVPPQSF